MPKKYIELEAAIIGLAASSLMPHQIDDAAEALQLVPAADVVERPRWIPVTERLPEEDCHVLAYYGFDHGDGYLGMMFVQVLDYYANDPEPHFQHEGINGMTVTHWMPLTEPPKEET